MFYGHAVCWVIAENLEAARMGAEAVEVDYEPAPALITLEEAIEAGSFQGHERTISRGDADAGLAEAVYRFSGEFEYGGQEHFYLETHASLAQIDENGQVFVQCSTQHPSETQEIVAHVLGLHAHEVTVQCLRMGGGFGGKEMQPHGYAAIAALAAKLTGRPVRLRLNRTQDMTMSGKRHPFHSTWEVGFDAEKKITGLKATLVSDGGWSLDLSEPVLARALCHIDNAYWIPNIEVVGKIAKTNKTSQTAFRGFGGPQGMIVIEDILGPLRAADGAAGGGAAPPQPLRARADHPVRAAGPARRAARRHLGDPQGARRITTAGLPRWRRSTPATPTSSAGSAITPVKFGISFNLTAFNQAGALVHVYKDGSVLINHGGTEMGQGLHTKMIQVAATALGVPLSYVRLAPTRTDKVPNTSATAASSGADLNGGAIKNACEQIKARLCEVAGRMLGIHSADVRFHDGVVTGIGFHDREISFAELVHNAYHQRVSLWAAGYYRTEGLHWDANRMQGEPFKYYSYGASLSEVEVDGFTGAYRLPTHRHRARRRRQPVPADRPRPGRGRLRPGRRLADSGGAPLGHRRRCSSWPAEHPGGQHVQAAELLRDAGGVQRPPVRAGHRDGRRLRIEGRRRAAADAGLQRAGGVAAGVRRVRLRRRGGPPQQPGHARRRCTGRSSRPGPTTRTSRPTRAPAPTGPSPTSLRTRILRQAQDTKVDWLRAVAQLRAEGVPGVLITVLTVRGHAPRDPGAKMVVGTDRTWGSVGGGNLEETAIDRARSLLESGGTAPEIIESRLNEHERTEHGRQCCGGVVQLLLEPLPARPAVAIFGIGHVGYELARILSRHEVQLHLVDSRAGAA